MSDVSPSSTLSPLERLEQLETQPTDAPSDASSDAGTVVTRPGRNGGRLRSGNPGNAGGRPHAIRAACREDFDGLRHKLVTIARARRTRDADRIRAIEVLGRFGLGDRLGDRRLSEADVRDALLETTRTIRELLPAPMAGALLAAISVHWLEL